MDVGNRFETEHSSPDEVRVVLVEDHTLYRNGLQELLEEADPRISVVADTGSGEAALELIPRLLPDVVLMDINLPGITGIEAIERLGVACPSVPVLVLSVSDLDGDILAAILAGARGYLLKDAAVEHIVSAVHSAASGGSVLSPAIAAQLLDHVRSAEPAATDPRADLGRLSPRESEVLRLMASGLENAAIGVELGITTRTVRNHVASILEKLQMENRIQAAVYAVKHGLA